MIFWSEIRASSFITEASQFKGLLPNKTLPVCASVCLSICFPTDKNQMLTQRTSRAEPLNYRYGLVPD